MKVFEEVLKKKIEVQHIPIEGLEAQLDSATDSMQKSFAGVMLCVAKGDFIDMKDELRKFPVKLTSLKEFASYLEKA